MAYTVCCECGKWLPIQLADAGSATKCSCGRRVEVPLLEEFEACADLLSATTVEARIFRLVATGDLPALGQCLECEAAGTRKVLRAVLDCERYTTHSEGGLRFLYIPFLFWAVWTEERRVEVRGHDTIVPAPVCVCGPCQKRLRQRRGLPLTWILLAIFPMACILAFFHLAAGVLVAFAGLLVGLPVFGLLRFLAHRRQQRSLRDLLRRVPVYRQMLDSYPGAVVVMPSKR